MTSTVSDPTIDATAGDGVDLRSRFAPIFTRIAAGAAVRDRERRLPYDDVAALKRAGFGTVLVPVDEGGAGGDLEQLAELLIGLAAADPNVAQVFRGHFHVVHDVVQHPPGAFRDRWIAEILRGALFSNAVTDTAATALGTSSTTLEPLVDGTTDDDAAGSDAPHLLNGRKDYATGNLFSDWVFVLITKEPGTAPVRAFVPTSAPGVERTDTWNGFGQRLTATGSTIFTDVRIEPWQILPPPSTAPVGDILQLVLLSVLAGIGRRSTSDAVGLVRSRTRAYAHAAASRVQKDPQVLQVIGEVASATTAAERLVIDLARQHDDLQRRVPLLSTEAFEAANRALVGSVYETQTVVPRLVLDGVTRLFDALGASATDRRLGLDRHWRNARTVASHNPIVYRSRIVGDWLVNGTLDSFWSVGAVPDAAPTGSEARG